VGRAQEEAPEDVYRYLEYNSDDERAMREQLQQQHYQDGGVRLDSGASLLHNGRQFNPDDLYFNDMDLRAWERRTAEWGGDGIMYDGEYGFEDEDVDEGYCDDTIGLNISPEEYSELLFQRALDKIRVARATGKQDVSLTPE
jgi:hypothetical protein